MICLIGNRPILQVGRQQVTGYGTTWLRDAIQRGAISAEREDFPFTDDLLAGIIHYLEHKCPLRVLTIEELHTRIRNMLKRIGCETIAHSLPLIAPPITLSLSRAAKEAGNAFELAFFHQIHNEIEDLKKHGAEELHFTDTRDCVKLLRSTTHWNHSCESLHQEILAFLLRHSHSSSLHPREIRLCLA